MNIYNRTDYLNKKCTHHEYYRQLINASTREIVLANFTVDELRIAIQSENGLSSIPLKSWDNIAERFTFKYKNGQVSFHMLGDYPTLAGLVCLLKETARVIIEEQENNKMQYHSTYKGVLIWRNTEPGYRLRWTGGNLSADTLAGLKKLITDFRCVKGSFK